MSKRGKGWLILPAWFLLAGCAPGPSPQTPEDHRARTPMDALSDRADDASAAGFAVVTQPADLQFPADHGAHTGFRNEWWYFTGNLTARDGRYFGFQLTFFRYGLTPEAIQRESAWATNQIWMAHFTVTDSQGERFFAEERFSRESLELAGVSAEPFNVWLHDWQAAAAGGGFLPLRLEAAMDEVAIDLVLNATKPMVLQGDKGFDPKGPEPGNASYYYSFTRMAGDGILQMGEEKIPVTGSVWMDREWSTSALGAGLAGWDWFGLQLDDGTELMIYRLRRKDGSASPFSGGSVVAVDGQVTVLTTGDFMLEVTDEWRSPDTGTTYPLAWTVTVPGRALELQVTPTLKQQELNFSVRYWEGAVEITGMSGAKDISGRGYLELVGY